MNVAADAVVVLRRFYAAVSFFAASFSLLYSCLFCLPDIQRAVRILKIIQSGLGNLNALTG